MGSPVSPLNGTAQPLCNGADVALVSVRGSTRRKQEGWTNNHLVVFWGKKSNKYDSGA